MGHITCLGLDMPSAPTKRILCSRYKPCATVYTFSIRGVQLYLYLKFKILNYVYNISIIKSYLNFVIAI